MKNVSGVKLYTKVPNRRLPILLKTASKLFLTLETALYAIGNETLKTRLNGFRIEDIFYTGILRRKANIKNDQIIEFDSTFVTSGKEIKQGKHFFY